MANGYGAQTGLAYKLPYEQMIQQKQYLKQQEQNYIQNNRQKMAKIAEMEQETYTDLPVYNKQLEHYYEGLNEDMGKVISKYGGDPFSSLDGMKELNQIHGKYLNNEYIQNAQKSKQNYDALLQDYKNGNITTSDFNKRQASYFEYGKNGDSQTGIKVPWSYERPNYRTENQIVTDLSSGFKTQMLGFNSETGTYTMGYNKQQLNQMVDLLLADPHNEKYVEDTLNKMQKQGIKRENLRDYLYNMLEIHYPDQVHPHKDPSNSGADKSPLDSIAAFPSIIVSESTDNNENIKYFVPKDKDGNIKNHIISFGEGNEAFSFANKGNFKLLSTGHFDNNTKVVDATLLATRQDMISSITSELDNDYNSVAGKDGGNPWILSHYEENTVHNGEKETSSVQTPGSISKDTYLKVAEKRGFNVHQDQDGNWTGKDLNKLLKINDDFIDGNNSYRPANDEYHGSRLVMQPNKSQYEKDPATNHYDSYSLNSLAAYILYSHATDVNQAAQTSGEVGRIMRDISGGTEAKHYMKINGVKLNTSFYTDQVKDFNKASGNPQKVFNRYSTALGQQGVAQEFPTHNQMSWGVSKDGNFMGPIDHRGEAPRVIFDPFDKAIKGHLVSVIKNGLTDEGLIRRLPDQVNGVALSYKKKLHDYHVRLNRGEATPKDKPQMSVEDMAQIMEAKFDWFKNDATRQQLKTWATGMREKMREDTHKTGEELSNDQSYKILMAIGSL